MPTLHRRVVYARRTRRANLHPVLLPDVSREVTCFPSRLTLRDCRLVSRCSNIKSVQKHTEPTLWRAYICVRDGKGCSQHALHANSTASFGRQAALSDSPNYKVRSIHPFSVRGSVAFWVLKSSSQGLVILVPSLALRISLSGLTAILSSLVPRSCV